MKRSEINAALKELEAMCETHGFKLPPFCAYTPARWETLGHEYDEIRDCMLGWDITDYGLGDFDRVGMSLITIRNGNLLQPEKYPKVYAEKLLYLKENSVNALCRVILISTEKNIRCFYVCCVSMPSVGQSSFLRICI